MTVSTRYYGSFDLVLDGGGVAHAAAELNGGIFYLTNRNGRWTRERISTPPGSRGHDDEPRIALDVDGGLAVGFIRYRRWRCELDCYGTPESMYVTVYRGGNWTEPTRVPVDQAYAGSVASFRGVVHVVAERSDSDGSSSLWHGTLDGGEWSVEQLAAPGVNASLAIAADGAPQIVFEDGRLNYVTIDANQQPAIETLPFESSYTEPLLTLDADDRPHIVYTSWDRDGGAMYTRRENGSWTDPVAAFPDVQIDDSCGETIYEAIPAGAVRVSDGGVVHVLSPTEFMWLGLWYASNRSGVFEPMPLLSARYDYCLEDIAIDGDPRGPVALAVDLEGRPHMLFFSGEEETRLLYLVGPGD